MDPIKRVIVIEDDDDDYELIASGIKDSSIIRDLANMSITHFYDAESAFADLQKNSYDLMIVDHLLAGSKTGLEFIHETERSGLHVPTVLLSGVSDIPFTEHDKELLVQGKFIFIPKRSLDWQKLIDRIELLIKLFD